MGADEWRQYKDVWSVNRERCNVTILRRTEIAFRLTSVSRESVDNDHSI